MKIIRKILIIKGFVLFLMFLSATVAFAADLCEGYVSSDTNKQNPEIGICIYYSDNTTSVPTSWTTDGSKAQCTTSWNYNTCSTIPPTCSIIAPKTGRGSDYHDISDEKSSCPPHVGVPTRCCAPNNATPIPPNPCPDAPTPGVCQSVPTAFGSIDVSTPGNFIKTIFGVLLSLAGGIAVILIIISGYRIMAAQGDPEKVKEAREMLTSAIIGLLFMIFSVSILQILGVDILRIPGFSQ